MLWCVVCCRNLRDVQRGGGKNSRAALKPSCMPGVKERGAGKVSALLPSLGANNRVIKITAAQL